MYNMSMENKFKYLLSPENIYKLTFEDYDGKPFIVEVTGEDILTKLRRGYALEKALEDHGLDKKNIDILDLEW